MTLLKDKILSRQGGILLYGITPPKAETPPDKIRAIAARQQARVASLGADGLVVYDLQDEPGRSGAPRPFPFLPTLEPRAYSQDMLPAISTRVIYKCVANVTEIQFRAWAEALTARQPGDVVVLVGAPTASGVEGKFGLRAAYALLQRDFPGLCHGGIAIAERHLAKGDEDARLAAKHVSGCRFFISQTVYDPQASKSLISDYALRFAALQVPAPPLILSFAPCGSLKTMEFMKWLGISIPRWLENELRHSSDVLSRSVELAVEVAGEVSRFARARGVPVGINVESVSIRKEEIEASELLFRLLAAGAPGRAPETQNADGPF
jgi:hypothetical protein